MILMRAVTVAALGCVAVLAGSVLAQGTTPEGGPTPLVCVTEPGGYYGDPAEVIRRRLDCYRQLGVEMLRVEPGWENGALPAELMRTDLRVKLILYVLGIPPGYGAEHAGEAMVDEQGQTDWHLGPWHRELPEIVTRSAEQQMERLKALGVLDRIDEVVADLGPAGEGIYPANWTLGRDGEEAFWCYSDAAQADFRAAMQAKYDSVAAADDAWRLTGATRFAAWNEVRIPQPGTPWARGPFWEDMLTWYREAKRRMMEFLIDNTVRIARRYLGDRAKAIIYLPGTAFGEEEWDQAVATAGGSGSVRLMVDTDWLIDQALAKGCLLQYTGAENALEVARIVAKLKARGVPDCSAMWAENAGVENAGRDPMWLAQIVCAYSLRGVDLTWSSWLFEADHTTPSPTYAEFARAAAALRHYRGTGEPPDPSDCGIGSVRQLEPGRYELTPNADTRLMGSFPDTIKGWDPEMAVVEGGQTQRTLIRFPLDRLPAGRALRSATLTLHSFIDYGDASTVAVNVYRVTTPWQEHAATWRARTLTADWEQPGGDAAGPYATTIVGPVKPGEAIEWNISALCREWLAGKAPNYGLMVSLASTEPANKSIAAKEHPNPAMRPRLVIELGEGE
ncbi:MAG TPA: DNRLRE domain-containing protein [Armatimonadota bacterium]|nr:DNRLRE domain-containing protein [Armatimonadota bacterium]